LKEEHVVLFMDLILPPDSQYSYLQDTSPMLDLILNWAHISIKHKSFSWNHFGWDFTQKI